MILMAVPGMCKLESALLANHATFNELGHVPVNCLSYWATMAEVNWHPGDVVQVEIHASESITGRPEVITFGPGDFELMTFEEDQA